MVIVICKQEGVVPFSVLVNNLLSTKNNQFIPKHFMNVISICRSPIITKNCLPQAHQSLTQRLISSYYWNLTWSRKRPISFYCVSWNTNPFRIRCNSQITNMILAKIATNLQQILTQTNKRRRLKSKQGFFRLKKTQPFTLNDRMIWTIKLLRMRGRDCTPDIWETLSAYSIFYTPLDDEVMQAHAQSTST